MKRITEKKTLEEVFTREEKYELRKFLRSLYREDKFSRERGYARVVSEYISDYYLRHINDNNDEAFRNVFHQNKLIIGLRTLTVAYTEMGLHGSSLLSFLLYDFIDSDDDILRLEKLLGVSMMERIHMIRKAEIMMQAKEDLLKNDSFLGLLISSIVDMRLLLLMIAKCATIMQLIRDTEAIEERERLSIEAAYIFAPLAHKLGLYKIKSKLEDLSLKYLEHNAYYHIKEKLNATKQARDAYIADFIGPLQEDLQALGLRFHIKGRTKSIHSIWQKMKKQKCAFEGVYDLFAIRIIIDAPIKKEKDYCWKAFSVVTSKYESNLKRLRDWLTVPKSNGYESLHITVLGPREKWVEVQIRTERMDDVAERGLAAHWRYKGIRAAEEGIDGWLRNIRNALEEGNEQELTHCLSADTLDKKNIYVFSPKGDLFKLPEGATILDFAYAIHTRVGDHCVGGRINGKNVSIRHTLKSGQKVEIVTQNSQSPKLEWLQIVVSPRAKSKIRAGLNEEFVAKAAIIKEDIERKLRNRKIEWDDSIWYHLVKDYGYKEVKEFYADLGNDKYNVSAIIDDYIELREREQKRFEHVNQRSAKDFDFESTRDQEYSDSDVLVIDKNLKGVEFEMAKCCNPVYGDSVFGFVTVSKGIKIHRDNCPNAKVLRSRFPYRIVKARWAGKGVGEHVGKYPLTLHVVGNDDLGIVNNITSIISKEEHIMLRSISIDSNDGLFSGIITLLVENSTDLNRLLKKIRTVKGIKSCGRM